jgi:uridine phosphorylase
MSGNPDFETPLLAGKHYGSPAVFQVESMLRETRRQRSLPEGRVPEICVLDPDGDIVSRLVDAKQAVPDPYWACYHTVLHRFELRGIPVGIIGCAVGGPFAVLLAEQLFASGCELLVSITSAGQIVPVRNPPYFVLIEKALRDDGTSHHYLPPARYVGMKPELSAWISDVLRPLSPRIEIGASWTTDAPYRETREAIEAASADGVLAVEMESASLYAFAEAKQCPVVCFAHITNCMGVDEGDFEKGDADGTVASLRLIQVVADAWSKRTRDAEPF